MFWDQTEMEAPTYISANITENNCYQHNPGSWSKDLAAQTEGEV